MVDRSLLIEETLFLYKSDIRGKTKYDIGIVWEREKLYDNDQIDFYNTDELSDIINFKLGYDGIAGGSCDLQDIIMIVKPEELKEIKKKYNIE